MGRTDPMNEGLIALAVAIIGASAGAIGIIAEFVTNRIADKPSRHDIAIGKRLDEIEQADRKRDEHAELIDDALKALLFDKIARLHAETVEQGLPVPTEIKTRVEASYGAYRKLGGNGVGKHYRDEMLEAHARETQP